MSSRILQQIDKDSIRQNLRRYTWQAYGLIPPLKEPRILELGCGTGMAAIELAVLSKGKIDAVDKDARSLALLRERAKALYLDKHIRAVKGSFEKLRCRKKYYDIVWSEASIGAIGFEKGLKEWKRFLKPGYFMVIHDEIKNYEEKISKIPECGFELIGHFIIPQEIWAKDYFAPLSERIEELRTQYGGDQDALDFLEREATEIEIFKQSPERFASIFMIMRNAVPGNAKLIGYSG
jgi:ubiquinone/menaquinone biosynthesis C-methylase UbiE